VHESAEQQPDLMVYLEQSGVLPGAEVRVHAVMPFNETVTLECEGQSLVVGLAPAALIFAEQVAE
jgi:Fe2+ transport system protein FeoA